jgi:hypothetical protein
MPTASHVILLTYSAKVRALRVPSMVLRNVARAERLVYGPNGVCPDSGRYVDCWFRSRVSIPYAIISSFEFGLCLVAPQSG